MYGFSLLRHALLISKSGVIIISLISDAQAHIVIDSSYYKFIMFQL